MTGRTHRAASVALRAARWIPPRPELLRAFAFYVRSIERARWLGGVFVGGYRIRLRISRDQIERQACWKVATNQQPHAQKRPCETNVTSTDRSCRAEDRRPPGHRRGWPSATTRPTRVRRRIYSLRDRGAQSCDLVRRHRCRASARVEDQARRCSRHATADPEAAAPI